MGICVLIRSVVDGDDGAGDDADCDDGNGDDGNGDGVSVSDHST